MGLLESIFGGKNAALKKNVYNYWSVIYENFQASSQAFYSTTEGCLAKRKIPNLKLSRTKWKEGGFFSEAREYLRIEGYQIVFDVCAAPFGTAFFISCRTMVSPSFKPAAADTFYQQDLFEMYKVCVDAALKRR